MNLYTIKTMNLISDPTWSYQINTTIYKKYDKNQIMK